MTLHLEAEALYARAQRDAPQASHAMLRAVENILLSTLIAIRDAINLSRPVNRLPAEVLLQIFDNVTVPSSSRNDTTHQSLVWPALFDFREPKRVVPLTHVCRRWRQIALASPMLWTTVDERSNIDIAATHLARSESAPLKILVRSFTKPVARTIYSTSASRIRRLYHRSNYGTIVNSFLGFPANELEAIALEVTTSMGTLSSYVAEPLLFEGKAPRLKVLVLNKIPWLPANRLENLTHLSINENAFSLSGWLKFLSGAPKLQEIILRSLRVTPREEPDDSNRVALNNLRRLAIGNMDGSAASCLISHLILPPSLALYLFSIDTELRTDIAFMRTLPRLPFMDDISQLSLTVKIGPGMVMFTVIVAGASSALRIDWSKRLYSDAVYQLRAEWVRTLLSILDMSKVQEFWVDGPHSIGDSIETLLVAMPSLKTIVLRSYDVLSRVYQVLMPPRPHCPNLATLQLLSPQTLSINDLGVFARNLMRPLDLLVINEAALRLMGQHARDETLQNFPATRVEVCDQRSATKCMVLPAVWTNGTPAHGFWEEDPRIVHGFTSAPQQRNALASTCIYPFVDLFIHIVVFSS